jgi:hypothetical protein
VQGKGTREKDTGTGYKKQGSSVIENLRNLEETSLAASHSPGKYPQSCIPGTIKTKRYTLFLILQAI